MERNHINECQQALGDIADFKLAGKDAEIPAFTATADTPAYLIDVQGERVRIATDTPSTQLDLNIDSVAIRREDVIRALDRRLRRQDILQPDMITWLGRAVDALLARGIELTYLARHLNYVADELKAKITTLQAGASTTAFQLALTEPASKPRLDNHFNFSFPEDNYPARWRYNGRYVFQKHFFGPPGELDDDITSEETACAIAIDQNPEVKLWVRNLERQSRSSFWLPTSTDRFYPDFVAALADGRILAVEYKGAHLYGGTDSKEKRDIGTVWASASAGRCIFVMVTSPAATGGTSVTEQLRIALVK